MDYKKTEAGEYTEENGNSSVERGGSSIRSNSLTLSVSGDENIFLNYCNVNFNIQLEENTELTPSTSLGQAGSSKAGTADKQPKRRAHLTKEDEATPRKKKRATSDTDKENIPNDQCLRLSKMFKNVKRSQRTRVEKEKGKKEPIPITKKTSDTDSSQSKARNENGLCAIQ